MARADLSRREQSDLTRETKSAQVSVNPFGAAAAEHLFDILDEYEPRSGLDDDATSRRPEIAGVFALEALPGEAMRLARDAANHAVHCATPCAAVEVLASLHTGAGAMRPCCIADTSCAAAKASLSTSTTT